MERDYGYAFMERNEERLGILEPADGYLGTTGNNPGFEIKGSSSNFGIRGDKAYGLSYRKSPDADACCSSGAGGEYPGLCEGAILYGAYPDRGAGCGIG